MRLETNSLSLSRSTWSPLIVLGSLFIFTQAASSEEKLEPVVGKSGEVSLPRAIASHSGYRLKQKSAAVGEQDLTIGEDALCASSSDGNLRIVARAPDWRVSVCNLKTGRVYFVDAAHFLGYVRPASLTGNSWSGPKVNLCLKPLSSRGAGHYMGQAVAKYNSPAAFVQHIAHRKRLGEVEKDEPQDIHYAVFNHLKIQAPAAKILSRLYRVPVKQGLPASLTFHDAAGRQVNYLDTLQIKAVTTDGALYEIPSRLEVVGSVKEAVGE